MAPKKKKESKSALHRKRDAFKALNVLFFGGIPAFEAVGEI